MLRGRKEGEKEGRQKSGASAAEKNNFLRRREKALSRYENLNQAKWRTKPMRGNSKRGAGFIKNGAHQSRNKGPLKSEWATDAHQ